MQVCGTREFFPGDVSDALYLSGYDPSQWSTHALSKLHRESAALKLAWWMTSESRSAGIRPDSPMARARRVKAGCVRNSSDRRPQSVGDWVRRWRLASPRIAASGSRVYSTEAASAAYSKRREK